MSSTKVFIATDCECSITAINSDLIIKVEPPKSISLKQSLDDFNYNLPPVLLVYWGSLFLGRYLDNNQLKVLPPGFFSNNTKLQLL